MALNLFDKLVEGVYYWPPAGWVVLKFGEHAMFNHLPETHNYTEMPLWDEIKNELVYIGEY